MKVGVEMYSKQVIRGMVLEKLAFELDLGG